MELQQSSEGRSANGTVARLQQKVACTAVAETEVAAGQDERVACVAHADDALGAVVVHLVVDLHKIKYQLQPFNTARCNEISTNLLPFGTLVFDAVDFLQEEVEAVDHLLLLERLEYVTGAVRRLFDRRERRVRVARVEVFCKQTRGGGTFQATRRDC